MQNYLCISFTFHDARFHGQRDGGKPEWPPSPLRVFQSIVAACANRSSIDPARPALEWLERQPTPTIIAPDGVLPQPYRIAVPNNDLDVPARYWARGQDAPKYKNPQDLKSLKTVRPMHFENGDTIHYLFPIATSLTTDESSHVTILASVIPSITHLGWGIDMVAARAGVVDDDAAAKLLGKRWQAVNHSATRLRVPRAGVLAALIERHDAFLHRVTDDGYVPVPPLRGFGIAAYEDTDRINRRPFAAFDLVPVDPNDRRARKSFRQEDAVRVAAMLRHLACEAAKRDSGEWRTKEWAEQFVAGHGAHKATDSFTRFSYLPLPTIGHGHADGMIRRALIAETHNGNGRSAEWAEQRLDGVTLHSEETNKDIAALRTTRIQGDSVFEAYCNPSDRWETITPVVLPGYDSNNRAKRMKLLLRCFEQAGIPLNVIADIEVQKSPWSRSSAQTRAYKRSERLKHLPACHVRVYFKRSVSGPLVIGAGRHRGLGLFAKQD